MMKIEITWENVQAAASDRGFLLTPFEAEELLKKHQDDIQQVVVDAVENYFFFGVSLYDVSSDAVL